MPTLDKNSLIELIPRYKNGLSRGTPRTERLREIDRLLHFYSYREHELELFQQEIDLYEKRRLDRLERMRKHRDELKDKK